MGFEIKSNLLVLDFQECKHAMLWDMLMNMTCCAAQNAKLHEFNFLGGHGGFDKAVNKDRRRK